VQEVYVLQSEHFLSLRLKNECFNKDIFLHSVVIIQDAYMPAAVYEAFCLLSFGASFLLV
jgi:hypothetical protein